MQAIETTGDEMARDEVPDGYDAIFSFRARPSHLEYADRLAKKLGKLNAYEHFGVTGRGILRKALDLGAEIFHNAERKYFGLEDAKKLWDQLQAGREVRLDVGGTFRLPYINSMNVMLTPQTYADSLFARGVVAIHEGVAHREAAGELIHLRMPKALEERLTAAIELLPRLPKEDAKNFGSTTAAVRLLLDIGLFRVDHDIYWALKQEADTNPSLATSDEDDD